MKFIAISTVLFLLTPLAQPRVGSRTQTFTIAFNAGLSQARYEFQRGGHGPCDAHKVLPAVNNWCEGVYPFWYQRIIECKAGAQYFVDQQKSACNPVPAVCQLRRNGGPCRARVSRWYFNPRSGSCQRFTYGGCGGNDNNFDSRSRCNAVCRQGANIGCPPRGSCPTRCGGLVQGTIVGVVWQLCPERLRPIVGDMPPRRVTITHQCEMEMLRGCYTGARNSFESKKRSGQCVNISRPGPLTQTDRNNVWRLCAKEVKAMIAAAQIP